MEANVMSNSTKKSPHNHVFLQYPCDSIHACLVFTACYFLTLVFSLLVLQLWISEKRNADTEREREIHLCDESRELA